MKSKLLFRISIPASLTIDYTILQTISVRREQAVLKIRHNKSEETFALKIRFSDLPTFELCPSMNDNLSNLLLPLHIVQDSVFTYEIYPFLESLSDYIRNNKPIDVSFLFQLICHIENSITTMHKSGYAHYDISARNIFLSHENNENVSDSILFYLGDFSCIKSISSKEQQKDINDFSKLFLLLLNHGNFSTNFCS